MIRVRFAPSPTGYLHIGSARTFLFNWLYARRHQGTMILRIDDTDVERNTQASLQSIMDGLAWLGLDWDEFYRQSERLQLHQDLAHALLAKDAAYRDFTPAHAEPDDDAAPASGPWLCNPGMRELSREESDARAAAGEPFVTRFRVPRESRASVVFEDLVYGRQEKACADIEDFALLRSSGMPTYHQASCADDIDLNITHVVRGQDHLSNTFKHILLFEAAGAAVPRFAHLPLLIAPDGAKLSKRKHGPVVSVTTYRDAGFLPHGYINFLSLLGWSPKDNREVMSRQELIDAFKFEGVNRSNAVVNFTAEDPIDPKASWINSQHLRQMPVADLAPLVRAELEHAQLDAAQLDPGPDGSHFLYTIDAIRSRFNSLKDFPALGRAYFADDFEIAPKALERLNEPGARELLPLLADRIEALPEYTEAAVEAALRALAEERGVKPGLLINASRAAISGQPVGPGVFQVFLAAGRTRAVRRLREAAQ
jgi:glutamyl-tRNA synthetase